MFNVNDPNLESLITKDGDRQDAPESFHIFYINHEQDKYKQKLQRLFDSKSTCCGNVLNSVWCEYLLRAEVEYVIKAVVDLVDEKYLDLFKEESIEININEGDDTYKDWMSDIGFSYGEMRNVYGGYE